jgi:hypothetical protein
MEFEGYSEGSTSFKNHNPGNLKWPGTEHDENGHSIFTTFELGWTILIDQLHMALYGTSHVYKPTDTLREFYHKYAEANSDNYAKFIADRFGVSPDARIEDIFKA